MTQLPPPTKIIEKGAHVKDHEAVAGHPHLDGELVERELPTAHRASCTTTLVRCKSKNPTVTFHAYPVVARVDHGTVLTLDHPIWSTIDPWHNHGIAADAAMCVGYVPRDGNVGVAVEQDRHRRR